VGLEVGEHFGEFGVVSAESGDIVPHGETLESGVEDACLEVLDFNGAHGLDAVKHIGENSTSTAGEKVQRVFWFFHAIGRPFFVTVLLSFTALIIPQLGWRCQREFARVAGVYLADGMRTLNRGEADVVLGLGI
jgi:hypothetical protein